MAHMAGCGEENGGVSSPIAGKKPAMHEDVAGENGVSNGDYGVMGSPGPASPNPDCAGLDPANAVGQDTTSGIPRKTSIIKDSTRQRRERKKTVSFSSMPADRKISGVSDCIAAMVEGCELRKVRSNARVYHRYFMLDSDMRAIRWEPSKKESGKARMDISAIREVRTGRNTDVFRSPVVHEQVSEDCAFSVIHGEAYETLDLVASSADVAHLWVTGLRYLVSHGKHAVDMIESRRHELRSSWLAELFTSAVADGNGHHTDGSSDCGGDDDDGDGHQGDERLSVATAVELIRGVNPGVKPARAELKFKEFHKAREKAGGAGGRGGVTREEFEEAFHDLCTRPEIYFLLVQFSNNKEYLDVRDLARFLEAEQGVAQVSEADSLQVILRYEPSREGRLAGCLSLDGFTAYLTSPECHVFDPEHRHVCQDMTQPLSHYYINASHNTYLIEDQFRGPADVSGYIRALKMGCRSVELDVWDGPENEPVVHTGHTLTSQVAFRSVVDVINRYAFVASEFPLILCVENHCSPRQQKVMEQHLRRVLGGALHTDLPNAEQGYLPSPAELRGRILLKGRKLGPDCPGPEGDVTDEDEGAEMSQRANGGLAEAEPAGPRRFRLSRELSDLVSLCQSVAFRDFPTALRTQRFWEFCSFNEALAGRLAAERPGEFVDYNKRFLARVYPSPMRIDSSNLNPQDFWKCGCQIVAMNYQTPGLMMDLNEGWFRQNGNCGFVLRPAIMREEVSPQLLHLKIQWTRQPKDSIRPGVSPQLLHLKIISGLNFPKPKGSGAKGEVVDPYVTVEIHGIPADCAERRTRTVTQNGDNPVFDESFEFQLVLPELALVRFVVLDDDFIGDDFIGQYTIPFECMQPGFRHIPLQSLTGDALPHAWLFVHVAITNRRGGGKPHKRGLSVRKARRGRDYACLRTLPIRAVDDVFKSSAQPLRDATDLRENMQNALVPFKELCGLPAVSNLKQCVLSLASRLRGADGAPLLLFQLSGMYPALEPQGPLPEMLRKVVTSYDMVIQTSQALVENADAVCERILQAQRTAMEFHENLQELAVREGLKGRKVTRTVESFTWNITILKGQADLLKRAKSEVQENLKQIQFAALTCNLCKGGAAGVAGDRTPPRRSLEAIPERQVAEGEGPKRVGK
ncbi:hypothetical protein AGOR_G00045200 [Albula goreensis]|uniref:Phosphoinositide phospholipase C n=1 Tax=Albula goreensis TaxID=1534307 RepID=A0A8T3E1D1_9TELE|nr:hypothetical protein AGOR_G00045200 [Albula goreensis]